MNASERLVVRATVECELMYYEVVGLNGSAQPTAGGALAPSTVDPLGSWHMHDRFQYLFTSYSIHTLYNAL